MARRNVKKATRRLRAALRTIGAGLFYRRTNGGRVGALGAALRALEEGGGLAVRPGRCRSEVQWEVVLAHREHHTGERWFLVDVPSRPRPMTQAP